MGKLLSFSMNYVFTCKFCSPTGLEIYRRNSSSLHQMCVTALANLQRKTVKDGNPRFLFSKDREIIPFIEAYWESITTQARKQTTGWYSTILKTLQSHTNIFTSQDVAGDLMFGLIDKDLESIKPNYDKPGKDDGECFARCASYNHDNIRVNKNTRWAYTATSLVRVSSYRFRHQKKN